MTPKSETLAARLAASRSEVQWRGALRDTTMFVIALGICGVGYQTGLLVLGLPVILMFPAVQWLQHDRRIGSVAGYIRDVIEPALREVDGVMGLDEYLDQKERAQKRFHFTSVVTRLFFPTLQSGMMMLGIYRYSKVDISAFGDVLVWMVIAANIVVVIWTFAKVKYIRRWSAGPDSTKRVVSEN